MEENKNYIVLDDAIRQRIRDIRKSQKIQSVKFSKEVLGKSSAYLSHIENGKINRIPEQDLYRIFNKLLGIEGEELHNYISVMLADSEAVDDLSVDTDNIDEDAEPSEKSIVFYDRNNKSFTETGFNKILENIEYIFNQAFKKNPEYTFKSAGELMRNMHSDLGFMLGLMSAPIHLLDKLDLDTKQNLFDEIAEVIKKYLDEYAAAKNDDLD